MYLDNTAYLCKELLLGVGKVIEKYNLFQFYLIEQPKVLIPAAHTKMIAGITFKDKPIDSAYV